MMKMRKMMALLLVLTTVAVLVAGCAGGNAGKTSDEKVALKFWAHQNEGWNVSHNDIVARFNASQDEIEVQVEYFPYDDYQAKIQTSMLAKEGGADIYDMWGGWALDFASTGALAEVSEAMKKDIETDYFAPTYGTFTYDGKHYGVSYEFNIESGGLLINKKQFDERGLTYPKTWDEMIDIAKANAETDGTTMQMRGFDFVTWDNVMYTWLSMVLSKGGNYLNADGTFNFTSPEAVEAMETLVGYVLKDKITNCDALTGGGDAEGHYVLCEDRSMMVARGPWVLSECKEIYGWELGKELDYISMPWYGEKVAFAAETGWGLAVSSASKNQEAAWKFVEFMMQEDNIVGHLITCGMLPGRQSLLTNERYLEAMGYVKPLLDILPNGQYLGRFNTDVLKENINNMFVALCTSEDYASVAEGLADLETRMNAELVQ